jgi:preprotein translocase subunit SecE
MYMKTSIDKMESELKILDPGKASAKRDLVETLKMQQSYVRELRTWPWKSETLRGFLSVIFLPILITVIQQLIERLF